MFSNSNFCSIYNCDYDKYYVIQAGGNLNKNEISFYTGRPYQRGYNFFTRFGKKYALPFLKYFGEKSFNYGENVLQNILAGENPKKVLKNELKKSATETLDDDKSLINQKGKKRKKIKNKINKNQIKKKCKTTTNTHSKIKRRKRKKRYKNKSIFD